MGGEVLKVGEHACLRSFLEATLADTSPNVSEEQAMAQKGRLSKIQKNEQQHLSYAFWRVFPTHLVHMNWLQRLSDKHKAL
jgi:hypothetical protein